MLDTYSMLEARGFCGTSFRISEDHSFTSNQLVKYLYIMWFIVRFQVAQNYTDTLPSIMLSGYQQKNVLQIHESHAHLKAVKDLVSNLVVAKQK